MHGFYRARLADAFCVGVDPSGAAGPLPARRVYRFSELGGVRLNIVATLNSRYPNEAPTMRGGFPLVFSSDGILVAREERRTYRVDMARFEDYAGPGRSSVMAAVAVSGAAISPLMGRFGVQMAPYRILLTLLNLRVGTWVRNPLHARAIDPDEPRAAPAPEGWLWLTSKPGLAQIATEAAGASSANRRWVYLSDGGHLDNTGLVECVRHCVCLGRGGRIVVLDASNDPPGTWSAVGDAIAVIRADLDIDLQRRPVVPDDVDAPPPPWARRYVGGGLEVLVVKAVRVERAGPGRRRGNGGLDRPAAAQRPVLPAHQQGLPPGVDRAAEVRRPRVRGLPGPGVCRDPGRPALGGLGVAGPLTEVLRSRA